MRLWPIFKIFLGAALTAAFVFAQGTAPVRPPSNTGNSGATNPGMSPNIPSTTNPTNPSRTPTTNPNGTNPMDGLSRGTMLTGRVLMDDGSVPPQAVVIERVCN